jgi:hypothetical protein
VQHEHFYQGCAPGASNPCKESYGKKAAAAYTKCFDAIVRESRKVNPTLKFAGPELGPEAWDSEQSTEFLEYFLTPENHADGKAPDYLSYHYPENCQTGCGSGPNAKGLCGAAHYTLHTVLTILTIHYIPYSLYTTHCTH